MSSIKYNKKFWNTTPLEKLSKQEWEALCDGCAKCCLHKLEDEKNGEIYYTDIVCNLINLDKCRCSDYNNRHINIPNCIKFNFTDIINMDWLPDTCAYKLRHNNEPLYDWHYLISGSHDTIHKNNESIRGFAQIDSGQDYEEHILYFKP